MTASTRALVGWALGGCVLLAAALTGAWADERRATYTNPVLDASFPDPSVIRVGARLYAYGTGQVRGSDPARYVVMSHTNGVDLKRWSPPRTVMPLPGWASGDVWAPDVVADPATPGRYVMIFSAETRDPRVGKCLGIAVSMNGPEGDFIPLPRPLDPGACGAAYTNIDPNVFFDPRDGRRYVYWGSNRQPLRRQQLGRELVSLTGPVEEVATPTPATSSPAHTALLEGAWVIFRHGRYYLFTSGDHCCAADDAYAVSVWRSNSPTGPWTRFPSDPDGVILRANGRWAAPGHNAIFTDGAGQDWIVYHARRPNPGGKRPLPPRVMLYDRIAWSDDGWPRVVGEARAPGSPSWRSKPAPVPFR